MIKIKISFQSEKEKRIINDILQLKNYELTKPVKEERANGKSPYNRNYMSLVLK